jgi:hypothetical protein
MGEVKVVRLLGTCDPKILKPLPEVLTRFDHRFCFPCNLCRNRNENYHPNPCEFRKNFAWKEGACSHFIPIALNYLLVEKIKRLTNHGLTLDEAIGLMKQELGDSPQYFGEEKHG